MILSKPQIISIYAAFVHLEIRARQPKIFHVAKQSWGTFQLVDEIRKWNDLFLLLLLLLSMP